MLIKKNIKLFLAIVSYIKVIQLINELKKVYKKDIQTNDFYFNVNYRPLLKRISELYSFMYKQTGGFNLEIDEITKKIDNLTGFHSNAINAFMNNLDLLVYDGYDIEIDGYDDESEILTNKYPWLRMEAALNDMVMDLDDDMDMFGIILELSEALRYY